MTQYAIDFTQSHARATDPQTSRDAALSMRHAANHQCAVVLNALRELGQGGAEQIASLCGMDAYQVRKRTADLERAGLIRTTGDIRRTVSGRSERVWAPA